jgi:hypothetical protein
MRLERLAKDPGSGNFGCPSIYLAEDGGFVVQGNLVDADTHAGLENLLPGEGAVHIRREVVEEALRRLEPGLAQR